jgi:hypothetical protein
MKTFDGQNLWVIVGSEGGVFTGFDRSHEHIDVILVDWDEFSTKDVTTEEILENLQDFLPRCRGILPPGNIRRLFRHGLVREYRQERPFGTRWWEET